ncbi:hypothetical protein CORC01_08576, partial [Colletotrichum orchidophilum]
AHRPEAKHHRHHPRYGHPDRLAASSSQNSPLYRQSQPSQAIIPASECSLYRATTPGIPLFPGAPSFTVQDADGLPPCQRRSTFLPVGSPIIHHLTHRSTHSLSRASSSVSVLLQTFVSRYHQRQYVPPIYFPIRHHLLLPSHYGGRANVALRGPTPTVGCSVTPSYRPNNASPHIRTTCLLYLPHLSNEVEFKPRDKTPGCRRYPPTASSRGVGMTTNKKLTDIPPGF